MNRKQILKQVGMQQIYYIDSDGNKVVVLQDIHPADVVSVCERLDSDYRYTLLFESMKE